MELEPWPEQEQAGGGSKYASGSRAAAAARRLRRDAAVFTRPLGDVLYLMCGPMDPPAHCARMLAALRAVLVDGR